MRRHRWFILILLILALPALGQELSPNVRTVITPQGPEIPFQAFHIEELINPETGIRYRLDELITLRIENKIYFQGSGAQFLESLNKTEAHLNKQGATLRQEGVICTEKLVTDPDYLNSQFLNDLKLNASILKDKLRPALPSCESITIDHLGINLATQRLFSAEDMVEINNGVRLKASQLVARINEQQQVLCPLGYSLFEEMGGANNLLADPSNAFSKILSARENIITNLRISDFHPRFNMSALAQTKDYATIAEEARKLVEARQIPGPEQLQALRDRIPRESIPQIQIPDLPNIPSSNPPRRLNLALKKRKDWTGINEGDRSLLNVYANAYYEIRGSETEQEASAAAKVGIFIFANEINALYGHASFFAGPTQVSGSVKMSALGQDIFPEKTFSEANIYSKSEPKVFNWDFDKSYGYQFTIGIIPVFVTAGARANISVGYEVALLTTNLSGSVIPHADAAGYAEGGVGVAHLVSGGAGAELMIININPKLTGEAGILFDPNGTPFLKMGLTSFVDYSALNGRVYAFAEWPEPRLNRFPPYKIKRLEKDLFSWPGFYGHHTIMNWSIKLSPFGVTMGGDLIDQSDREETAHLKEVVDLEQRKQALHALDAQVAATERAAFLAIQNDDQSPANTTLPADHILLMDAETQSRRTRLQYIEDLIIFADSQSL